MSKPAVVFTREDRAFEKALSGFFECDAVDKKGEFDGVDGGGIYAASACCASGEKSFEASIIANPGWVGVGSARRLGWVYALQLWCGDKEGSEVNSRSIKLSVEQGEALMRCERPAAMALATLKNLDAALAPYLPEIREMALAARVKADLGTAAKKSSAIKKPTPSL